MTRIDADVPLPPDPPPTRYHKYPFERLAVGQSFFLRPHPGQTPQRLLSYALLASQSGDRKNFTYDIRIVTEKNVTGVRCWRIK